MQKMVMSSIEGRTDVTSTINRKSYSKISVAISDYKHCFLEYSLLALFVIRLTLIKKDYGIEKPLAYFFAEKVSVTI